MVTVRDDTAHSDRTESTYARGGALGGRLANCCVSPYPRYERCQLRFRHRKSLTLLEFDVLCTVFISGCMSLFIVCKSGQHKRLWR